MVAARARPAPVAWAVNRNALYIDKISISRYRSTQLRMYIYIYIYIEVMNGWSGVTRTTLLRSRRARGQRPWRGR